MKPRITRLLDYFNGIIGRANIWILIFITFFLVIGIVTLHNYGLTWDEGLGDLFFGERYFQYFISFDQKYLDFNTDIKSLSNLPLHLFLSPFHNVPEEFPPLADTFSAVTMYIFSYRLKLLNPIDGFHLFTVFLSSLFLWIMYRFAESRIGKFGGFMSILFLATFPRFWADMHFNAKDIPEMIFFSLVVMSYWSWYEKPSLQKALYTGALLGCSLGIKANAIFIIPILLASIFPWSFDRKGLCVFLNHFKKYFWHYFLFVISSISVYLLSWPYLYTDTLSRLKSYWVYIFSQGGRSSYTWNIDPIRQVLTTMPEFMLLVMVISMIFVINQILREKAPFWRLLFFWAIIPIIRVSIPGAVNFDGIRHFLEFLPAVALICGYGTSRIISEASKKWHIPKITLHICLLVLQISNIIQINIIYYPYLHLYYNEFVGGLAGAKEKFLGTEATDYWASSYRQGMQWIDQNVPIGSPVTVLIAPWIVNLSAPVMLRPDIQVISKPLDSNIVQQSKVPFYVMFITREGFASDEINFTRQHAILVYQLFVDKVQILCIYKFGGIKD